MRKGTHIRNSHKWTRCAILGLALTVTPFLGSMGTMTVSHGSGALTAASSTDTTSASSGIGSDSWKWT